MARPAVAAVAMAWVAASCSGATPRHGAHSPAIRPEPAPADASLQQNGRAGGAIETSAPAPPTGISEAHARDILARRFRAAGLRVLFDVEIELGGVIVAVDGFDPQRGIGFEYSAPEEHDQPGPPREASLESGPPIVLWIDAASEERVRARLEEFASRHLDTDTDSDSSSP